MSFRLANPASRWLVLASAIVIAACVTLGSIHNYQADHAAADGTIAGFTKAANIEPGNAYYWHMVGYHLRTDPDNPNPQEAIGDLQRSLAEDPRDAETWMDLADAYEEMGNATSARHAYEEAAAAYPDSSDVDWRYGSFLLRQGQSDDAYRRIREALAVTPTLTPLVISRVWRATQDTHALLTRVLPNPEYDFEALDWFCEDGDVDASLETWNAYVASGKGMDIRDSFKLTDLLLESQRGEEARVAWRQAVDLSGHATEIEKGASLVFNGGFEFDSLGGGLDWFLQPRDGVGYEYDDSQFHSGKRSLHISFDGSENFDFKQAAERVPVKPQTAYHFSGFLRTEGISTESGMRFAIMFPQSRVQPILLESLTGDNKWTEQTADFVTGSDVHSVNILIARLPSRRFDNKLRGAVWIDDVKLIPASTAREMP